MSDAGGAKRWWFCLKHDSVEEGVGCGNTDRMGPYASEQEASRSLQTAAERTEAWDEDERWKDD